MKQRTKLWMVTAALVCGNLTAFSQQTDEQFSIATLNVDGLPKKILVVNVNADGPGDAGTARIGKYLQKKGYDLVMLQEDFNYHNVLSVWLEDDYKMDEWTGDVGLDGAKIDFLHLQNHRFECDGLMACWKNDLQVTPTVRTPWTHNFGKFSHENDELITKGFRRYDATLRGGKHIVVYNMHMDATLDLDEAEGKAAPDHDARMAQWAQLKEDVLQNLDSRPVIIVGDMNSLYGRDEVKRDFIDAINESGRGKVSDVWVELQRNGVYPSERVTEATAGDETLDKILYINPTMGTTIQPIAIDIDRDGYLHDGKPLGDHYPVVATFQVVSEMTAGVNAVMNDKVERMNEKYYDLKGQRVSQPHNGIFIEQQGEHGKSNKKVIK